MLFPPASRRLAGKSGFARAEPLRPLRGLSMRNFIVDVLDDPCCRFALASLFFSGLFIAAALYL